MLESVRVARSLIGKPAGLLFIFSFCIVVGNCPDGSLEGG